MVERAWGPDIDKSKKYSQTHTHTQGNKQSPEKMFRSFKNTVPDPDLELRGGGGLPPKFFSSLGP